MLYLMAQLLQALCLWDWCLIPSPLQGISSPWAAPRDPRHPSQLHVLLCGLPLNPQLPAQRGFVLWKILGLE